MQQHFDTIGRQRTSRFRKPDVVADRGTKTTDVRHIKNAELDAGGDVDFVRKKREQLGATRNDLALRIDDGRGVVDLAVVARYVNRARQQPDAEFGGSLAVGVLDRPVRRAAQTASTARTRPVRSSRPSAPRGNARRSARACAAVHRHCCAAPTHVFECQQSKKEPSITPDLSGNKSFGHDVPWIFVVVAGALLCPVGA